MRRYATGLLFFLVWFACSLPLQAAGHITLDGRAVDNLWSAFKNAKNGSLIELSAGEYNMTGHLTANNVTIMGEEGTILTGKTNQGKGALVISGNNTTIINIECHSVKVKDQNGSCVRLQGKHLTLKNVYFHDSQQGILSGRSSGKVLIENSRFERLGKAGRAHGIYLGSGQLIIRNSYFLSSKGEGHEIKTRGWKTLIENTVVASLDGKDSRLVDVSNGGILIIRDSVLQQGNKTSNWNLIGYGLEGYRHKKNTIELTGNVVLAERKNGSQFLQIAKDKVTPVVVGNAFVGKMVDEYDKTNFYFEDREEANLPPYPHLPEVQL